ncbi:MAG: flagellar biosynthesis protein FliQ [Lachnospiraceae bacterium]|nr:flagellar biosynthesis protein FliQ [Lachnospiraceae bacterium]
MDVTDILVVASEAIWLIIKCSMPVLISSLVVGLIISIFQTVTSIQEQTLTFVPKLLVVFLVLILSGNWILTNIVTFIKDICERFGDFVR